MTTTKPTSEFHQVFESMNAPDYPATCDQCGMEGTNADMDEHICGESPASRAGQPKPIDQLLDAAIYAEDIDRRVNARVQIAKQHATLIEQRELLLQAITLIRDSFWSENEPLDERIDYLQNLAKETLATIEQETEGK